ncbi:MAG: hypothetical protein P4L56_23095 [Candidatus Sulfopaludibacter sp.]|nr:hypothetical protein [Candidatus Sulfopaludibacter sp.]
MPKILGDISTVEGAAIAGGAILAAGLAAAGAAAVEAADQYAKYVGEVAAGTKVTGLTAEQMSALKFQAQEMNVGYEDLVQGLTKFTVNTNKAAEGSKQQEAVFQRLGISQEQVKAGQKDMMPLLEATADRIAQLSSRGQQTAAVIDLLGRHAQGLVPMLAQGAAGIHKFAEEAAAMGLIITSTDIEALKEYKAELNVIKAEHEALDIEIGRNTLPILTGLKIGWASLIQTLGNFKPNSMLSFFAQWGANAGAMKAQAEELAKTLAKFGQDELGPADGKDKVVKTRDSFYALSDVLETVQSRMAGTQDEYSKIGGELNHIQFEVNKATEAFEQAKAKGTLSAEAMEREAKALAALPAEMRKLAKSLMDEADTKKDEKVEATGNQIQQDILRQGQQTMAVRAALWEMEMAARRAKMEKEHTDTAANLASLARLEQAGYEKIGQDAAAAVTKAGREIDGLIAAQGEQTVQTKKAALNRQVEQLRVEHETLYGFDAEYENKLDTLRKTGLAKIDADEKAAGDLELSRLKSQLEKVESTHQTTAQRIQAEYEAEAARFAAVEEKKTLSLATSEAQRAQITQMFAAIRKGLLDKEGADLQALQNTTGWQGVFGNKFGELIRGNESMLKQWQGSTNQSTMLVKLTLEGLKEQGQKTFDQLTAGMGQNIAHSVIYEKSIGQAMKAMLESTLESLSAQAITYAIYSTALGFTDLAEGNAAGATAAFTAAAIWGSVGAAAAVAGRGMVGSSGGAGSQGPGGVGVGSYGSQTSAAQRDAQMGAVGAPGSAGGQHITVNVQGHLVGWANIGELTGAINDAVLNSDQTLTATNTKTGVQVTR